MSDNPPIRIYVNQIENRITFEIKTGYYIELLTLETIRLFGTTKDENGKNVHHLEIAEVVLVHSIITNNIYQQNLRALHIFVPNKSFGQSLDILSKN